VKEIPARVEDFAMSLPRRQPPAFDGIPPLENGDQLTRAEFERRYEAMPNLKKAELIEGVVYVPTPARLRRHSSPHSYLLGWAFAYKAATPGVESASGATVRLSDETEVQPDGCLFIDPARGGQARISADDYIELAPDLMAEIAASSVSYDLGSKLTAYRRNGVREYIVWRVLNGAIDWLVLRNGDFEPLAPDERGILKSEVFPGLWLDAQAMLAGDLQQVLGVLQEGLATPEHAAFVARLEAAAPKS
jgi:Uma2 family endonuclease